MIETISLQCPSPSLGVKNFMLVIIYYLVALVQRYFYGAWKTLTKVVDSMPSAPFPILICNPIQTLSKAACRN